ncbi:MAG: InlB B-repeat-containing protein, partial [Bacteroidales bacterium]|nr:InlB B-repeat-containing protein [Bacteroidales bacterium]
SKVSKYTYTQGCSLPTNVTRTGYTFGGWYTNSNFSGSAVTTISTTDSGNKTYYAKWIANTYTVSLNTNGGTLASAQNVTSYTYATTVTLPTPTKVGYTFSGWYANSSFTGSRINSISSTDIGNKQYWAKWTVNTYYILYNGSGNTSGSMTKTTCTYNVGTTLTKNAFVKTGYTFQGWATSATATSAAYTDEQSIINLTAENGANINLYALWNANQYTISLDQQDATVNGTTQITVFFDAQPQSIQPPTKIGYGFDGFFTQPYGEGEQYYTSAGNPLITAYKVAENLELYAKWTARDYIITYNNEGGTITTENYVTTYTYGTMVTLPSIERNGCTFGGWFTNQNCEGAAVTEIEASEYGDKVFYAKWTPITYDVALNENGGQIKSGKVSHYTFGIGAILPTAMNMKRDGHTFAGWYDNEELSGDAINAISVADYGDKEYWAKWEEGAYVVTLQTNGGTINSGNIVSYKYQTGAALPTNVTKTGYTFAGWYENSSCLGTSVSEITDSDMGDKSYWAKWIENVYDVSFHENEGTINNNVVIENYTFSVGASLPADVTRKGYSFGGWYDNEECSGNPVTLITTTEYGEKEFWAKWDIINYSITFNNNGGTFSIQEIPSSYQLGTEITLPRQISREGYTFDGWYDNSNFTNTEISRIENDEVGNKLFYAKWLVNTYDITLNTNEGTINSGNVANYTYGYGISLPSDVTKPGYSFAGWYADEDFTTARITRVSETMSGNLVFYAKWTENTYSITLNVNDGTIAEEYVSNYTYGMGSTLPTNVTRQGYTFMGWFVNSNFDGSAVKAVSATEYGDKTFWAKWQVETYTVTLQTNGGTINAGNISGYMFGVGAELPSDVTKTGHSFVGWYADEDFNSAEFSAIAVNETGDKTFYAKWTVDNYSISYNINGGMINEGELDEYTYGFGAELPTDVTRTGYTFVGWYDNVNLIGTPFTEITEEDFGNKSFYAKWNTNIYAIEYDVNGGTINSGNVTSYQYGSDVILPTDVTRQGYTFTGWHFVAQDMTEEEGAVAIMQVSSIDFGDKTYYAWWTNNTYTITYFTDQGTINEEPTITYTYG